MQTFLPYPSFYESAKCLDNKRLGKQRVECKQIYLALTQPGYGWKKHPATKMWIGYEQALAYYGWQICREWRERGFNDSLLPWFKERVIDRDELKYPDWLYNEEFHASHRSNLLRKDPVWYGQFGWTEPEDLEYVWPVK